jgi:predicted PurR-regulated permease PerM
MSDKNITININTGTFIRIALVGLILAFLFLIRDIVALVIFSIVIASGVEPAANWFQKRKVSRVFAVIFVYLILISVIGLMFYLVVPTLFSELSDLLSILPTYLNPAPGDSYFEFLPNLPQSVSQILTDLSGELGAYIEKATNSAFKATSVAVGGVLSLFMVFVLSFYFAVQEKGIENFLRAILPLQYEEYAIDLWTRTREKIGGWLKGQVLLALLFGVLVFLVLTILRVKYALILALLAGVLEIIPVFGPILSGIPATGIALLQSPATAVMVGSAYFVLHQMENHLLYPLIVRRFVGLSPVLVIIAMIVGAKLGGFVGVILSVPIVTFLAEIMNDFEKKKRPIET